jgi:hypothetical protein
VAVMKNSVAQAAYVDLKFIKGRKCAQIVLEIPTEQASAFVEAFGTPNPAVETWVALARLDLSKAQEPAPKEKRKFAELPIAQQAALLCGREAFWKFLRQHPEGNPHVSDEERAAYCIYRVCGIASRAELSVNAAAAGKFQTLSIEFEQWLHRPL